jgi:endonuclease/exonuclease/phosphatase family metal-dependent hydrolase
MRVTAFVLALPGLLTPAPGPATARAGTTDTLTVVTLNLWHDQRDWPRRRSVILEGLRALSPDVICLQEVLQHATLPNQALTLADSLGYRAYFVSVDPDTAVKRYGNAILSRRTVLRTGWKPLAPRSDYRVVAHAEIEFGGGTADVYCTHLHHTLEGSAIRAEQVRDLLDYVGRTRGRGGGVLAGDFNAAPGAPELAPVSMRFVDAFAAVNAGAARDSTTTTLNGAVGHAPMRIDHVWVARDGRPALSPVSAAIVFDAPAADGVWASDHFGVVSRIAIAKP